MKFNCALCAHLEGRRCVAFKVIFPHNFNVNRPNDMCNLYKEKEKDGSIQEDAKGLLDGREHE